MKKFLERTDQTANITNFFIFTIRGSFYLFAIIFLLLFFDSPVLAQLDENCIANILNRTIQVSPNGTFAIGQCTHIRRTFPCTHRM